MNRRSFLSSFAAVGAVRADDRPRFGLLTVDGHRAHKRATGEDLHVWVDGQDVTKNCYEADDERSYAIVFCTDPTHHRDHMARGAKHVRGGGACRLRLTGRVIIGPGDPL